MKSRTIAIMLVALAAAYQVVRTAIVDYSLAKSPATAARIWPCHPRAAMKAGLNDIGVASVELIGVLIRNRRPSALTS